MTDNEIMKDWKKSSIVIGSPTNILAALTSFIPVICSVLPITAGRPSARFSPPGAWLQLPLEHFIL